MLGGGTMGLHALGVWVADFLACAWGDEDA